MKYFLVAQIIVCGKTRHNICATKCIICATKCLELSYLVILFKAVNHGYGYEKRQGLDTMVMDMAIQLFL